MELLKALAKLSWRGSHLWSWLLYSDKIGSQFVVALSGFLWAGFLFAPGESLNQDRYVFMHAFGSDLWWGLVFLASALLQTYCILFYAPVRMRCATGLLAVATHIVAAMNFWFYAWPNVAVATASEIAIAITAAISYLFTPVDHSRPAVDADGRPQ